MKLLEKILPWITGLFLAAFALYVAAWYFNLVESNFSLILFIATLVTGIFWLLDRWLFLPARRRQAQAQQQASRPEQADSAYKTAMRQPWWLDWTAGLFPVLIVVFLLRSFLWEPFKIPSGSMLPTLEIGDFILVNKFQYGVRLPVINKKIIALGDPQRGDVMVFRYPPQPNFDYIKRVIGLPGDKIDYINKRLFINGKELPVANQPDYLQAHTVLFGGAGAAYSQQFTETIFRSQGSIAHNILNDAHRPARIEPEAGFLHNREHCEYFETGLSCYVPDGHYFVMGDNRDNSQDSRYWGFVPDENIVGQAVFIWMNFNNMKRFGRFQ